jgi:hypothetical protein
MSQNLPFKKVKFPKPKSYKDYAREAMESGQYKKSDFDVNYGEVDRKEKDHFKQKHAS